MSSSISILVLSRIFPILTMSFHVTPRIFLCHHTINFQTSTCLYRIILLPLDTAKPHQSTVSCYKLCPPTWASINSSQQCGRTPQHTWQLNFLCGFLLILSNLVFIIYWLLAFHTLAVLFIRSNCILSDYIFVHQFLTSLRESSFCQHRQSSYSY